MLALASITMAATRILPAICMPVLFKEIADDLGLNLTQIGAIWGMFPLGSIFVVLIGGLLSDRFGFRRTLIFSCFLTGLSGAARGFAFDFIALMATSIIFGMVSSIAPTASSVAAGSSLSENRKGLAQGILMTTAGTGMVITTSISATVLSPLLGGWRNVMFFYGVINIIISGLWLFTIKQIVSDTTAASTSLNDFLKPLLQIIRIKAVWLIGMVGFFYMASVQSMVGFLPLYLRGTGWTAASADVALATFMASGAIGAIPLALLSDKIGRRKIFLLAAFLSAIVCMGFLTVIHNQIIWGLIIFAGFFNSIVPALLNTICFEEKTVEPRILGMAISFNIALSHLGMAISAPIGNSLAYIYYGLPFVFWTVLAILGLIFLGLLKETGWCSSNQVF